MRFKIQTTVLLFVLLGTVSACNTFKDEIAPDSYMAVSYTHLRAHET